MPSLRQRTRNRPPKQSEAHILPLINVVFLLLIFFMIAGQLTRSDPFELAPPKSLSQLQIESPEVLIYIGIGDQYALNDQAYDKAGLLTEIKTLFTADPQTAFQLKVDQAYPAPDLMAFLAELRQLNLEKVHIFTHEVAES